LLFMVIVPKIQFAVLSMADSLILMVMALVVFGPRRLPQIGRQIGKLMYEFRKASNDFKFQMEEELRNAEDADRRKKEEERLRALALTAPAPAPAAVQDSVAALTAGPATDPPGTPEAEAVNPSAIYDNGPVASTQVANSQSTDAPPAIRPPSTGDPIAAARAWSREYEEAKAAQAARAADTPAIAPAELEVSSAATEPASSEAGLPESAQATPVQAAGIAVNHHG
jgi:sec-independent protein translocase protein TatB